ncbi:RNA polymerase sigma factor [Draconibacterium sp. IB214405]|uniref:RNA polymerase sigma factor n=1 Tax=Draconibacterium sp. IB214405 TaxID=3097352 RepID=UPI002A10728D|nr:RNA polymerase sigma factor [Draconibacterium sp. IB214405]MDX8341511.1 RNA polymerase sigma factor [Draconibacterium sp. IB214405]
MEIHYNDNEVSLIKLCKKGDAKAQYRLYKLYCKGMYNVAIRMTNDKSLAEDVLQDAFVKAFSEIDKLKNEKAFGGWLKRIVINQSIDVTRKEKMFYAEVENLGNDDLEIAVEIESEFSPERIHHFIKQLPDGAREILVLRALEGYKHAEIGEKLGISESTAKTQFFRAKQLLVKMMQDETGSGKISEGATA